MERILKSYGEFCAEEISIRKALAGAAIGAGLALSSPAARTQVKAPEKAGIMKDVEAMKKDVLTVKVSKDIKAGDLKDSAKVDGGVYKAPKGLSDKEVAKGISTRKLQTKSIVRCSGIDELIDRYDARKSLSARTYFMEGYDFPEGKLEEYKDLLFSYHTSKEAKEVWKWAEKEHSVRISFNSMDVEYPLNSSNLEAKFDDGREIWTKKRAFSVANVFFLDRSDVKKGLAIVEGFKKKGHLTAGEMIAIFNFGFIDGTSNLRSLVRSLKYVCKDQSSDIWNVSLMEVARRAKVGRERKETKNRYVYIDVDYRGYDRSLSEFAELDYSALMKNVEGILSSLEGKGVVQLNPFYGKESSPILDMEGKVDDSFVPVGLKKGDVLTLLNSSSSEHGRGASEISDQMTICKMSKQDGEIVWLAFKSNGYLDELGKIGEVVRGKDSSAVGAVYQYASKMLDRCLKESEERIAAFSKKNEGRTTVVARIGKAKVVGAVLSKVSLDRIKAEAEKDIVDKLSGYDWRVKDTSDVTSSFESKLKSMEYVVLQRDNGEKAFSTIEEFEGGADLGTGPLKYEKDLQMLIDGRVKIGMDKERVRFALGDPDDIDRTASKSGYEEIYIYRSSDFHKEGDRFYLDGSRGESTYLYFEGGLLVSIMDR